MTVQGLVDFQEFKNFDNMNLDGEIVCILFLQCVGKVRAFESWKLENYKEMHLNPVLSINYVELKSCQWRQLEVIYRVNCVCWVGGLFGFVLLYHLVIQRCFINYYGLSS